MTEEKLKRFSRLLKKKYGDLRKWAEESGVEAFRIYHKDIGDLPLTIDLYGKYLHIVYFEQKGIAPLSKEDVLLLAETAGKTLYIQEDRIVLKFRNKLSDKEQYEKYSSQGLSMEISEYGLSFKVNLSDYIDTGLFLDHRDTRMIVRQNSAGRKVLNLFSYTGSFSVYAAAGGASSTTSVDLSNVYLNWARENMAINQFKSDNHVFENSDVFAFLEKAKVEKEKWDLIILDPPTFSNSRKMEKVLDIQKDHVLLINSCLDLLSSKGLFFFSNNNKSFKLDPKVRERGFVNNITEETIPEDFKGSKIHKCWVIEKRR